MADLEHRIALMTRLMKHRGPDKQGFYVAPDRMAAIGGTRLAIVDVNTDLDVPMTSADGQAVLSFNGEIYNYREERDRLAAKNVKFRTKSDTEVLLEGLHTEGEAFLERLDGVWGFAYYQPQERRLCLSRDLLGERHIFYMISDDELAFASEMNPLLAVSSRSLDLDQSSVVSSFRFRAPPPGKTLIAGVQRLLPGHNLIVDRAKNMTIKRHRRYRPEKWFDFFQQAPSLEKILDVYEAALWEACRTRVPSEVDYVASLSGGLDSAVVALFTSNFGKRRIQTLFGASTDEPRRRGEDLDEESASYFTANKLATHHHRFDMIGDECVAAFREQCANSFDGLFCEGTINFRQLAEQVAHRGARVLVLSDGPDELLGGYDKDFSARNLFHRLSRRPVEAWLAKTVVSSGLGRKFANRIDSGDLVNWSFVSMDPFHFRPIHGGTSPETMKAIFPQEWIDPSRLRFGVIPTDYTDLLPHLDLGQRMALSYATSSLPDYFNVRTDRGSNWHSIECRLPLQAPAIVELMLATPSRWRFNNGSTTKFIFRKIVERHIGKEIAYRGKYGFAMPAWHKPSLAKKLNFEAAIRSSKVFDTEPFKRSARKYFLRPDQGRSRWLAYCLAQTYEKLRGGDFAIESVPRTDSEEKVPAV